MIAGHETHDVDIYRPVETEQPEGDDSRVWSSASQANVAVVLEHLTAGRAQQRFGKNTEAAYGCMMDEGVTLQEGDVMQIVAGDFGVGLNLLVTDLVNRPQNEERMAGLVETNDGP